MGLFRSKKEKAKSKGKRYLGPCPFCGGEIEYYATLGDKGTKFECDECDGLLISSGSVLTSEFECISGPDEYVGENKHRNVWARIAEEKFG